MKMFIFLYSTAFVFLVSCQQQSSPENKSDPSTFMGFNTWAAWQGTAERAAVCGDFTMLENEVAPVIKALVENGIEVVAVHNHMVHETPKSIFSALLGWV